LLNLAENGVGSLVPVDFSDIGLRKVDRDEIHFAVVVLEILLDLLGILVLEALPDHLVGHVEQQDQRLREAFFGDDFTEEVSVVFGRRVAVEQQPLADVGLFEAFEEELIEGGIGARLDALNIGLFEARRSEGSSCINCSRVMTAKR